MFGIFSKLGGYLMAAAAGLLALWGMLANAKRQGRKEEQAAQTEVALKQVKESIDVDTKVRAATDADLDERLRKHTRD